MTDLIELLEDFFWCRLFLPVLALLLGAGLLLAFWIFLK
jgi:hypothetical protein